LRSKTGGRREFTTKSTKDTKNGIRFKLQHPEPVEYKGVCPDCGYRMDLLVEDKLIIELKSVEQIKGAFSQGHLRGAIADLHAARGSEDRSPLMNFNPTNSKGGIKRFVLLRALRVLRGEIILYLHSEEQARSSTCGTTHYSGRAT